MWKRLQGYSREKERRIGNPVLLETTYDEKDLNRIPNVHDLNSPTDRQHHPSQYSSSANQSLQPPQAPFAASGRQRHNRTSEAPSSVYSQPSPNFARNRTSPPATPDYADVSPPSSPEPNHSYQQPRRNPNDREVSPVDENGRSGFNGSVTENRGGSSIPVLRKPTPGSRSHDRDPVTVNARSRLSPSGHTRWDVYSGEPTTSEKGRPGQVDPGFETTRLSSTPSAHQELGNQVQISGGPPRSASKNGGRSSAKHSNAEPKPREPWSLGVGRAPIAQPLVDKPSKQPLNIPTRAQRGTSPQQINDSGRSTPSSATVTVQRLPKRPDTMPVSTDVDLHEEPIKPTVPLKVGRNSPPRGLNSPTSPSSQTAYPSPISPGVQSQMPGPGSASQGASKFHAAIQQYAKSQTTPSPAQPKIPRKSIESNASVVKDDQGPVSRFSWTTYNTNTTYQHSPPPSPPPPMPTTTIAQPQPLPVASTLLHRRRPVPKTDSPSPSPSPIVIKSMPTPAVEFLSAHSPTPSRRTSRSAFSKIEKDLPRPPPELTSTDHIGSLQAQMDDLNLRRTNVNRLLSDLNKSAPVNPLVTNFREMRVREKRRMEFEEELREIAREEHDVGLRLHRAWRKKEANEPGGMDSVLWVRRITN